MVMRRDFLAGLGALAVLGPRPSTAAVRDPLPAEGVELSYRLSYGGNEIGLQKIRITEHSKTGRVVVEHDLKAEVRMFFAVVYSLEHRSTEVWDGFKLTSLRSETIENSERYVVEGEAAEEGFRIRNGEKQWSVPTGVVPSDSFWLAAAMEKASVVNVRTGDSASPVIERLDDGRWHLEADFEHGPMAATVRFDGDFLAEAEIDSEGHTVRLERIDA